ncbi:MAG: hypothetical protein J6Y37_09460 [Paludibacteraceae bacterium]|nr:hypothetical protein [Paludibacteraceae bacterium]
MKKIYCTLLYIIFSLNCIGILAQSTEIEQEYADKICQKVKAIHPYYQELIKEQFRQNGDSTNVDDITFLNIYTVYATKKAVKEKRKNINRIMIERIEDIPPIPLKKEDLLTYIDPKKIDCKFCFLYKDSVYMGLMIPYMNRKNKWSYGGTHYYCMDIDERNALYKIVREVKPEVIFEICQNITYFFIKEKKIYGIIYDTSRKEYLMVSLKEYIDKELTQENSPFCKKKSMGALCREYPYNVKIEIWEWDKHSNCEKAHKKWLRKH